MLPDVDFQIRTSNRAALGAIVSYGFYLLCAALTLAFLTPAVIIFVVRRRKRKKCTVKTMGTLVRYNHTSQDSYCPVFEFEADDIDYQGATNISSSMFCKKHRIGDSLELFYDPNDPETIYVPEQNSAANLIIGIFTFLAALMLFIFWLIARW